MKNRKIEKEKKKNEKRNLRERKKLFKQETFPKAQDRNEEINKSNNTSKMKKWKNRKMRNMNVKMKI